MIPPLLLQIISPRRYITTDDPAENNKIMKAKDMIGFKWDKFDRVKNPAIIIENPGGYLVDHS